MIEIEKLKLNMKNGNLDAAYSLAKYYYENGDQRKFKYYLKYASTRNHAESLHSLGLLYKQGKTVTQNYSKAYKYFYKAYELGLEKSKIALAVLYQEGKGVKKDLYKALKIYESYDNNSDALYRIGEYHAFGMIYEMDLQKARIYFEKALVIDPNNLFAKDALESLNPVSIRSNYSKLEEKIILLKREKRRALRNTLILFAIFLTIVGGLLVFIPLQNNFYLYLDFKRDIESNYFKMNVLQKQLVLLES